MIVIVDKSNYNKVKGTVFRNRYIYVYTLISFLPHHVQFDYCTKEILKNLFAEDSSDSESDAAVEDNDGQNQTKTLLNIKHEAETC